MHARYVLRWLGDTFPVANPPLSTALGPMLWTGSDDHTIRVWDTNKCACKAVLSGHGDSVLALSAGAGGTSVWSASSDGSVRAPFTSTRVVTTMI